MFFSPIWLFVITLVVCILCFGCQTCLFFCPAIRLVSTPTIQPPFFFLISVSVNYSAYLKWLLNLNRVLLIFSRTYSLLTLSSSGNKSKKIAHHLTYRPIQSNFSLALIIPSTFYSSDSFILNYLKPSFHYPSSIFSI